MCVHVLVQLHTETQREQHNDTNEEEEGSLAVCCVALRRRSAALVWQKQEKGVKYD